MWATAVSGAVLCGVSIVGADSFRGAAIVGPASDGVAGVGGRLSLQDIVAKSVEQAVQQSMQSLYEAVRSSVVDSVISALERGDQIYIQPQASGGLRPELGLPPVSDHASSSGQWEASPSVEPQEGEVRPDDAPLDREKGVRLDWDVPPHVQSAKEEAKVEKRAAPSISRYGQMFKDALTPKHRTQAEEQAVAEKRTQAAVAEQQERTEVIVAAVAEAQARNVAAPPVSARDTIMVPWAGVPAEELDPVKGAYVALMTLAHDLLSQMERTEGEEELKQLLWMIAEARGTFRPDELATSDVRQPPPASGRVREVAEFMERATSEASETLNESQRIALLNELELAVRSMKGQNVRGAGMASNSDFCWGVVMPWPGVITKLRCSEIWMHWTWDDIPMEWRPPVWEETNWVSLFTVPSWKKSGA